MIGLLRGLSRPSITVHVDCGSVRVLAVRGGQVTAWDTVTLEPGLVREGVVSDTQVVAQRLRSLFERLHLGKRGIVAALSGQRSVPRILTFPRMERRLLDEAIARQMKREVPLAPEEMYCSWQVIPSENSHLRVFALGVPRDALRSQVETIRLAGGKLTTMDVKPLALVRAVGRADAVIANLEPETIDVVVVREGIPATIRTVGLGDEVDIIEDKVRKLGEEMTRTVKFYNDTHRDEPLSPSTPVYLTGSLAAEATASGIAEASVGRAPETLVSPFRHPPDLPLADFAVNIGLALKEAS